MRGQDRLHGDVVLVPRVSWRLVGAFLFTAAAIGAAFLASAAYRETIHAPGRIGAVAGARIEAVLDVPAARAGALARGETIRILAGDFAEGREAALSARIDAAAPAGTGGERMLVRATIDPASRAAARALRPGAAVSVRVAGERRTLGDWLVRSLGGGAPR